MKSTNSLFVIMVTRQLFKGTPLINVFSGKLRAKDLKGGATEKSFSKSNFAAYKSLTSF